MAERESLNVAFEALSTEMKELYPHIETLEAPPDPLTFFRKFVSQNRPVVIKNAINNWPALTKWGEKYFRSKIGHKLITVAVTPNGYADAIYKDHFVMPEERRLLMSEFLDLLHTPVEKRSAKGVFYIQQQNSNLKGELSELLVDVDPQIPWGTEAFGSEPDAVNFWMGDAKAVTSMHKDHYENLYCVVSGHKTFTLLPPTDLPFIPYESYPAAVYKQNTDSEFDVINTHGEKIDNNWLSTQPHVPKGGDNEVPWIAIDPLKPDLERYPQYALARPMTVRVQTGDMLYLPSLWFHHVQQSQACIAVNYWYDMEFDIKWAYYQFLQKMSLNKK